MSPISSPEYDWESLSKAPEYQSLLRSKRQFILPASVFFVVYYFSLLVLVGWWPDLMKIRVGSVLNLAYVFAVSEFFMAWGLALIYVRKAAEWDRQAASVIAHLSKDSPVAAPR
jgi:uncharacterized membrane protein (DUF485 family)